MPRSSGASVERIDVFKPEKVPGTRTKKQTILIHWNFIGAVELPQEQKNRHSRISPNYADIFPRNKIP
ncbi:MAG: DUF4368 domain-containing protein [[Ruminococcus] torques]